ncbi:MAG TPA: flagellar basal body rod protein FlgC [Acidobacteriota bacterium]|nr:flagellar basal body rod protein FlgC [Acidobacteriota bacterium]
MSGLFSALDVSASALNANRRRMELLVTNIANSQTTRTAEGGPYKRKDVVFMSTPMQDQFQDLYLSLIEEEPQLEGVRVSEVVVDQGQPQLRYQPNHPDADEKGFVAYPDINPIQEMANLMGATRSYEANIKAFEAVKQIVQRSIDLGRRG